MVFMSKYGFVTNTVLKASSNLTDSSEARKSNVFAVKLEKYLLASYKEERILSSKFQPRKIFTRFLPMNDDLGKSREITGQLKKEAADSFYELSEESREKIGNALDNFFSKNAYRNNAATWGGIVACAVLGLSPVASCVRVHSATKWHWLAWGIGTVILATTALWHALKIPKYNFAEDKFREATEKAT